ncbi:HK97 family phage prohead protease [Streptomyces sp. 3MP-14]|uniref:HK97 family phage prohead protease n=1 Tax=Streptomyces mimosae TaxID=2586635 RepID=A0A5N6AE09_9ACTN|nr:MULTISPECIES: HK97 family phage prohead protease [Streptomyces]KAB8167054.1 HK97 family phage prohead protease [Streptomyces mimosae]KAB8176995.1 HK97 family phage prohead protease [Streptomyces sp. 3MP-14]
MRRTREVRAFPLTDLQVRAAQGNDEGGGRLTFRGRAIVYDSLSEDMGGWRERIMPGAATRTLAAGPDVRFLINHDPNLLLARTAAGTASLHEDDAGVMVEADMADVSYARDLAVSLERGDITQMSFGFWVTADGWSGATHEVFGIDLDGGDVSAVTYPAFAATSAELRAAAARQTGATITAPEPEAVTRALAEVRAGKVLSAANRQLVADAYDALGALLEAADRSAPTPADYPAERARHRLRELELLARA